MRPFASKPSLRWKVISAARVLVSNTPVTRPCRYPRRMRTVWISRISGSLRSTATVVLVDELPTRAPPPIGTTSTILWLRSTNTISSSTTKKLYSR